MMSCNIIPLFFSCLPLETASTTPAVRNPPLAPSQVTSNREGQVSENIGIWQPKPSESCGTFISSNGNSVSRTQSNGGWLSSFHVNVSRNPCIDETEDSKNASAWSVPSGYLTRRLGNQSVSPLVDPVGEKKFETGASCIVFGVNLKSPCVASLIAEKSPGPPGSVSNSATEEHGPSTLSGADSDQKSDLSKASKEPRQRQMQTSPKEVQSKQSCSTRSRVKV